MNNSRRSCIHVGIILIFLFAPVTHLVAQAAGKTYTNTTKRFSITLPSGWIKLRPDSSNTLFSATVSNQAAQWALLAVMLKNKQAARTDNSVLRKKQQNTPKQYGLN